MLIDFLASLSFYVIPYLTGRFFTKKTIQAFVLGSFLWFIIFFLTSFILSILKINEFALVIRSIAVIISSLSLINILVYLVREKPKISFENIQIATILTIFTAFVYFFIWKRNTPYPLQLNWDIYEHITLANSISLGNISFLTSKISDTFTFASYSPLFGILLSIPKIVFGKSLLGIYWWLEYWHFLITAFALFLISRKIFINKTISVLSSIVSSLTFESVVIYSTLFLIPQTLVAVLTILIIAEIKEYKKIMLLIAALTLFLMHFVVGALSLFILLVFYLANRFRISQKILNISIVLSTFVSAILIGLNFVGNWQILGREEAVHFSFNIVEKLGFLLDWYGIIFFVFAAIGYVKILKNGNYALKIILILALLLFGISFAPFSYFLKFYVLGHYFVNLVIVAGIAVLIANLPAILKYLGILWIAFVLLITFYRNQLVYKDSLHFQNNETQVSFGEIEAGEFLASYNKNGKMFLISDPSLQYIFEATSGINTQGGAYMDTQTRRDLIAINGSYDGQFIKNKLLEVKDLVSSTDGKRLFAVGGRYFAWQNFSNEQKQSTFYNIWTSRQMSNSDLNYVNFLKKSDKFRLIYQNKEVAIFEII